MIKKTIILIIIFGAIILIKDGSAKTEPVPSLFYLTWESDGGAPLNYEGKILATIGSIIKVSVQPLIYSAGEYLDSSGWEYKWFLNDEIVAEAKGLKDFRFRAKDYNAASYKVRVKVVFSDQSFKEKELTISIAKPKVLIKPFDAKVIIKGKNLETNNPEIKLQAVPYFFGGGSNNLRLSWYLNDQRQKEDIVQNGILTVKKQNKINQYSVSALMEDISDSLIRAVGELNIKFVGL